ncbi:persephin [Dasypus novemcinctus]|uniref:persephin n=1 Tax=Dasypus novemcinctus TaxID=9361 RepID=UPI00265E1007|nr:persephin [Dasypus novemcinctus]
MATGSALLRCLLLLSLCLAPVSPGLQAAKAGGTQRPQLALLPPAAPSLPPGARLRRAPASPCQLWSLTLPVAELGLGYASEEKVIFRYCAGSCPRGARTQHGLVLARLRGQGRAHGGPCCRPTRFTDVVFLDDHHRWQRLSQLSAAACSCGA